MHSMGCYNIRFLYCYTDRLQLHDFLIKLVSLLRVLFEIKKLRSYILRSFSTKVSVSMKFSFLINMETL
jgi:hypothetical protein